MILTAALALTLLSAPFRAIPPQEPHAPGAPQTDETVAVQKGARLTVNNFAGEVVIHTWNREGTYNFATIEGAQAEVSAESVRGDIVVKGGAGFVTAKSIQGEIVVEGSRGRIAAQSVNEAIRISDSNGDITAESTNGAITMTRCSAQSVDASTVNGDITYDGSFAVSGHYQFNTHNGDISLSVPETASATFTVRTYNGEFRSDLPLNGASREEMRRGRRVQLTLGSGAADVNIESFGGSIRIRKAGAVGRQ
jgi:DUF4097 and DUF4098 domain-containing protein YvlB